MDLLHRLLYAALGAVCIFYLVVKISLSYWKKRGILHEKPKFFWGNIKGVGSKRHITTAIQEIYEKYKDRAPFIGFYVFLKPMVLVLDLDVIKHVLCTDGDHFTDRGLYHNVSDDPLSANLMQLEGEKWRKLRGILRPIFIVEKMQQFMPALLKVAETFKHSLDIKKRDHEREHDFCINDLIDCFNIDVISSLAFGLEGDSLQYANTEFCSMSRSYFNNFNLLKAYLALNYPSVARLLQYKTYDQTASAYFLKLINDKIKEREWSRIERHNDFLNIFIELNRQRKPKNKLSHQKIAAQAFAFIAFGLDACNATLTCCLYELALQPDIQERARIEIENILRQHNDEISVAALKDMKYLKQILYEALRKHSPYPFLLRYTVKDYEVPGSVFMLRECNHIIVPIAAIHNDPNIYPQPERFDPERFSAEAMHERHPMAWLPFGFGSRNCIASHFAEMQMLVCLITMLRTYKFSPCSDTSIPLQYDNAKILLLPKSNTKLRVERLQL